MTVTLYNNTSDTRYVHKDLAVIGVAKPVIPLHNVSRDTPVLILSYNDDLLNANYCYIDVFKRFYYCTVNILTADRVQVVCTKCDVLASWADELTRCPCQVIRSESQSTPYIEDKSYPINSNKLWKEGIMFPNSPLSHTINSDTNNIVVAVISSS